PKAFHLDKAGLFQPRELHLLRRRHAIKVQKTTTGFNQGKSLRVNGPNDFRCADVVNRYRRNDRIEGYFDFSAPARLAEITNDILEASFERFHALAAEFSHLGRAVLADRFGVGKVIEQELGECAIA